ncbi:hypothetical protein TIFTF001_025613 [Ficus carica]|uniref:Uncharacterized protein n=1 Tax=Ficus carica TaxID=3494 RepID=A0AA88B1H6_FICCA|nr:hypothetical protein TIFTF001_025613 [Ficus carica]
MEHHLHHESINLYLLAETVVNESANEELIIRSDEPTVVENKHYALKNLAVVAGKELIATSDRTMEAKNKLIEMDAHDAIFIQEKTLTRTDVNENTLVFTSTVTTILKEEEKTRLEELAGEGKSSFKGIEVLVLDASATDRIRHIASEETKRWLGKQISSWCPGAKSFAIRDREAYLGSSTSPPSTPSLTPIQSSSLSPLPSRHLHARLP